MQRRKFLATATLATTVLAVSAGKLPTNTSNKKCFIVKNGEARFGKHTPFGINPTDTKISAKDTDGIFSVFEFIGKEKVGPPLHLHFAQDEIFYVIEGEYLFQLDQDQSIAKAGDTVFLPKNVPHTWLQLTDKGKLIYLLQPAGKFEEFFEKFSTMKELPPMEEMQKFYMAYGMKIMGPPLSAK
jgi:quercetin dioxygenase-like cupin family protein